MTIAEKFEQEGLSKGLSKGLKRGREIGREIGRKEGIQEVARNMLAKEWDIEEVQEMTGLTGDELKQLL